MTISFGNELVHRVDLLHVPPSGRWTLEFAYPGDTIPSGLQTLQWGNALLVGTVDPDHVGASNGEVRVKLVGGWGWSQELPVFWHQSDNPGVRGRTVAAQAAQLVGETLYGSTGQTEPSENIFRPLRVSYSRSKQTAGAVLLDVLAPGQTWWVDFDGATRVGVRVAPSPAARVALLDYDAGSKWADLECDDPGNLVGATIPADPIRGTPALVINELFAWTTDEGFRYRAAVAPVATTEHSRLAEALRSLVRGFVPELPALELRRALVTAQANDGRVSLRQVDRAGEVADFGRTEGAVRLYAGTPGTSADFDLVQSEVSPLNAPEVILAFSRADWSDAFAFLSSPLGMPGHVPKEVRHEARVAIRLVGASDGIVYVGATPTQPVALANDLVAYLNALEAWALQVDIYLALVAAAIPLPLPTPAYPDAVSDRVTASGFISNIPATRLEAK